MKKFFLLVILATIVAFTSANAQSISVTVNSIDWKYNGIDAAKWCPPGSVVSANVFTRTITITDHKVETFKGTLTNLTKVNGNWVFTGIASDKTIKNAKITLTLLSTTKAKIKVVLASGEVYRRTLAI
jgi:hypothetical protein